MTTIDQRLAKLLEDAAKKFKRLNKRQQDRVIRAVDGTRLSLTDLLADFSDSDGMIAKSRLNRLLRELKTIEDEVKTVSLRELDDVLDESAQTGIDATTAALLAVLGTAATREIKKREAKTSVMSDVAKPRADGLRLPDRTIILAGDYSDALANVLRTGIIRGWSVSEIMRRAKAVYDGQAWKLRRIVVTECNIAYRRAVGESAQQSQVVRGLKLHAGIHRSPACVALSEEDRHGLGQGVFLPGVDDDIYEIHPNCTSYITYVLDERWL